VRYCQLSSAPLQVALLHPFLILCSKIILQFVILEPNKVLLPTNLSIANKRKFYLCALCAFALKKSVLSFLALEKSKIAPKRKLYLFSESCMVDTRSAAEQLLWCVIN
jgi:hypothetical protein